MIITGPEIGKQVKNGRITIEPFNESNLNPNSYNFRLGNKLVVYATRALDSKEPNPTRSLTIPPQGLVLEPTRLYLGQIVERIGSNHYVPIMRGRSSIGRLGLFINITADLVDQGAFGQWTLQLHAIQPVRVYAGMSIGQMTFWVPKGKPMLYSGKYQGASEPMPSLSWRQWASSG